MHYHRGIGQAGRHARSQSLSHLSSLAFSVGSGNQTQSIRLAWQVSLSTEPSPWVKGAVFFTILNAQTRVAV